MTLLLPVPFWDTDIMIMGPAGVTTWELSTERYHYSKFRHLLGCSSGPGSYIRIPFGVFHLLLGRDRGTRPPSIVLVFNSYITTRCMQSIINT